MPTSSARLPAATRPSSRAGGCLRERTSTSSAPTVPPPGKPTASSLERGRVYTEITEFALAEAGDLLLAIEEGHFARSDIVGEIGHAIDGGIPGRTSNNEITVYKSLGNIAQDLAAAHFIYTRAIRRTPG